jgi:peptidoglycan/LPS O-acetylase OafA/YrhL
MDSVAFKDTRQLPAIVGLLDFCKGIAIVWVMLVHAIHGWFGWQGVHVFILLGGFALTYACLNRENQLTWGQWFRRRAARILPAYWLVATAGFFVICVVAAVRVNANQPFSLSTAVWRWFADLTLLRNFSYKTMLADPNSALWFIPLIVSLYLLFPWLYSSLAKHRSIKGWLKVLLVAAVVEIIYRAAAIYWLDGMPVGYGHGVLKFFGRPDQALNKIAEGFPFQLWAPFGLGPSRVGEFAIGMIGAFILHQHQAKFSQLILSWRGALVGVVVWLFGSALIYQGRWTWAFADLFIAAGVVVWMLKLAAVVQTLLPRLFRAVSGIGVWSYYLFLTHLLFGYAHANLFHLWAGRPVLIVLMLILTLVGMIGSSWLLLRLDRSGLPKRLFGLGVGRKQGVSVSEGAPAQEVVY